MKKLTLILVITVVSMFMFVAVAMAGGHGWKKLNGEYYMTSTGNCLHSTLGFNPNYTPITGVGSAVWAASTMTQGIWTFNPDGTGTADLENFVIDFPPGALGQGPIVRENTAKFSFTYEITREGVLNVTLPNGFILEGMVSQDHKTLALNSAYQPFGTPTTNAYCNTARVLIRVDK